MAERRMFAKTIISSDAFLDMPISSQNLYFHLAMNADDDGFVNNPKSIMRNCGCKDDDINILLIKKFILPFDNGIIVIKHWRIHNYIQKDRYTETKYVEQKSLLKIDEKGAYTFNDGQTIADCNTRRPLTIAQQKRFDAKKESSLPYSFEYKIRQAFIGEICPICGSQMGVPIRDECGIVTTSPIPTIQHNKPISKGGTHSLENISVICQSCNYSIQDKETGELNNKLVVEKWESIGNVSGMDTQVRLELGKNKEKEIYKEKEPDKDTAPNGAITNKEFVGFTLTSLGVENKDTSFIATTALSNEQKESSADEKKETAKQQTDNGTKASTTSGNLKTVKKISEAEIITFFAKTWEMYPRKVNKVQSLKTYGYKLNGLSEEEAKKNANKIYTTLKKQIEVWGSEGEHGREFEFMPHFSTWLNANFTDSNGKVRCR